MGILFPLHRIRELTKANSWDFNTVVELEACRGAHLDFDGTCNFKWEREESTITALNALRKANISQG